MTSFIIYAALITFATLALLIWPLTRARSNTSFERRAQNIHFAKERLVELEAQLKSAAISATDYEALKMEIERTLAHDLDISDNVKQDQPDAATVTTVSNNSNKLIISLLLISIPLSAIGFYLMAGTPEAIVKESTKPEKRLTAGEINAGIIGIEQRLLDNPDDLEGWKVISRTYLALGKYAEAENAYTQILRLDGESAETFAALADTIGLKEGGKITELSMNYALKSLKLNANNGQALWLAGLGSAQRGNMPDARQYWSRLVPLLDNAPQQQQELKDIIAQSFEASGQQQAAEKTPESASELGLKVNISLSPGVANLADPNDIVFVFAKAKQGPPAPLAAKKLRVSDLPATLVLGVSDAMIAQLSIAKFEDILVSARVSKSGQPMPQAGDLESISVDTKNNSKETINVLIKHIIK